MSYLVRPTKKGYRVIQELRTDGQKKVVTVPRLAWTELGFNPDMTVEQAKFRAAQINSQDSLESNKVTNTARRLNLLKTEISAYLPAQDVAAFEQDLADMYADNPYRLDVNMRYWRAAQAAILDLAVDTKDFFYFNQKFLNYFKKKLWSSDYVQRIIRTLNMWGKSVSRRRGSHYEELPPLNASFVQALADNRDDVEGIRTPAEPLTWEMLRAKEDTFKSEGLEPQWKWLKIALWFGLRGLEVDNIKKGTKFFKLAHDADHGLDVVWIYQTKLKRVAKDKRWKPIPVYTKEQGEALKLIQEGNFRRPLHKTLRRIFGEGIQPSHSARKAFTDLMLNLGFELKDISIFLGHQSIDRTWKDYKDKRTFSLPKKPNAS